MFVFRVDIVYLCVSSGYCVLAAPMATQEDIRVSRKRQLRIRVDGWTDSGSDSESSDHPCPIRKGKKLKLSLSKRKGKYAANQENPERFAFIGEAKVESLEKRFVPKNTDSSTKWALSNFLAWRETRNTTRNEPESQVPEDLLISSDAAVLCKWLTFYVAETRKKDGSEYPPKTVYLLLSGLLRHMRSRNASCPNFLDTSNPNFATFHNALDNVFRDLRSKGVGAQVRQTEAFSREDEEALWESGALGCDTPKRLLRTVFFLNGKNFCLRGGAEQRNLKINQLKRLKDPMMYIYTENASKNKAGGLAQMRVKNKVVSIVAVPESGDRCHVLVLDAYLSKLPLKHLRKIIFMSSQSHRMIPQSHGLHLIQ